MNRAWPSTPSPPRRNRQSATPPPIGADQREGDQHHHGGAWQGRSDWSVTHTASLPSSAMSTITSIRPSTNNDQKPRLGGISRQPLSRRQLTRLCRSAPPMVERT